MSERSVTVPMEVDYTPSWLSWVAATMTCLRALGMAYDPVDVAGLVNSFKGCMGEPEPPIPFDRLNAPGGSYVLAFPTTAEGVPADGDREALVGAVARFRTPSARPNYQTGAAAYDLWIAELQAGRADAGGNAYNAACYAEGRKYAREFLERVADGNPTLAALLAPSIQDYAAAADAMARVTALFPFRGQYGTFVDDERSIAEAVESLRAARAAECRAVERLAAVAAGEWAGWGFVDPVSAPLTMEAGAEYS